MVISNELQYEAYIQALPIIQTCNCRFAILHKETIPIPVRFVLNPITLFMHDLEE